MRPVTRRRAREPDRSGQSLSWTAPCLWRTMFWTPRPSCVTPARAARRQIGEIPHCSPRRAQEKFLHDRIKVNGKAGNLGDSGACVSGRCRAAPAALTRRWPGWAGLRAVKISRDGPKITVVAQLPFSKRYLKVRPAARPRPRPPHAAARGAPAVPDQEVPEEAAAARLPARDRHQQGCLPGSRRRAAYAGAGASPRPGPRPVAARPSCAMAAG